MGNLQRLGAAFVACVVGAPLAWAQDGASISALVTAERQAELSAGRSGTLIELAVELGSEVAPRDRFGAVRLCHRRGPYRRR